MGKPKPADPEPKKILRTQGENLTIPVTEEEKKYRNKNGPDNVTEIPKEKLKCTVCARSVENVLKKKIDPYVHMVLGVLICKECASFYGDGYFSVDEDGDDKYCRWCGQGGTLYLCSQCSCAFCKKCIKQNLGKQDVKDLESDDWQCLICNPKPLYECRTICWMLQEHANAKKSVSEKLDKEQVASTSKRDKSKKTSKDESTTPLSGRKRKASEVDEDSDSEKGRETKKRRNSDSVQENKQNKKVESSSRKRGRPKDKNNEELSDNDNESIKPQTSRSKRGRSSQGKEESFEETDEKQKTPTRSKRGKSSQAENEDGSEDEKLKTPSNRSKKGKTSISEEELSSEKRPSRSQKKVNDVTQSDEDNEGESDDKNSSSSKSPVKSSKKIKESKKSQTPKDETPEPRQQRSKRSTTEKPKNTETPQTPTRTSRGSDKKAKSDTTDKTETPLKRSQRSTKGKTSSDNDNDSGQSKDDENFSGKEQPTSPCKSIILTKNADAKAIQACKFINSALKDVQELTNLITSRCGKLCSKSVQTTDDFLLVYNKLKLLIGAAHNNLNLIEKGLMTKISRLEGLGIDISDIKMDLNTHEEFSVDVEKCNKKEEEMSLKSNQGKSNGNDLEKLVDCEEDDKIKSESEDVKKNNKVEEMEVEGDVTETNKEEETKADMEVDKDGDIKPEVVNENKELVSIKHDTESRDNISLIENINVKEIPEDSNVTEKKENKHVTEKEENQHEDDKKDEHLDGTDAKSIKHKSEEVSEEQSLKANGNKIDESLVEEDEECAKELTEETSNTIEHSEEQPLKTPDTYSPPKQNNSPNQSQDASVKIQSVEESVSNLTENTTIAISLDTSTVENKDGEESKDSMKQEEKDTLIVENNKCNNNHDSREKGSKNNCTYKFQDAVLESTASEKSVVDDGEEECNANKEDIGILSTQSGDRLLSGNDVPEHFSRDSSGSGNDVSEQNVKHDDVADCEKVDGTRDESCSPVIEEKLESDISGGTSAIRTGDTTVKDEDMLQSPSKKIQESDGLKNGTIEDEKKEPSQKEEKIEENKIEKRKEEGKNEKGKEEDKTVKSPPADDKHHEKTSSRSHQFQSSDRSRHSQGWSGSDRDRSWSRDRYQQERGWSGGRGGSPYPHNRWQHRAGWGWNR